MNDAQESVVDIIDMEISQAGFCTSQAINTFCCINESLNGGENEVNMMNKPGEEETSTGYLKAWENTERFQRNGNSGIRRGKQVERMALGLYAHRYRNRDKEEIKERRKDEGRACQYASEETSKELTGQH